MSFSYSFSFFSQHDVFMTNLLCCNLYITLAHRHRLPFRPRGFYYSQIDKGNQKLSPALAFLVQHP